MPTLAQLKSSMRYPVSSFSHGIPPAGHFAVMVKLTGVHTNIYLLEGTPDDPESVIKGRFEERGPGEASRIYVDSSVSGGSWVKFNPFSTIEQAFASMV